MAYLKAVERREGGHFRISFFSASARGFTMAKNGELVYDEREIVKVRPRLKACVDCYEVWGNEDNLGEPW